ncbi:MAG: DUF3667 domain-containing protein [Saprospiraceae bacterium]|nr:DUF3667 domain-containing protein [Saprospiraceae bacterium]
MFKSFLMNTPNNQPIPSADGDHQPLDKIDSQYIRREITSVLNLDKGILYTIKEITLRPGQTVRTFIHEDRSRLIRPLIFIIICSLCYTIMLQIFKFEDGYMQGSFGQDSEGFSISNWFSDNYGYTNIIMGAFIALWVRVFFRTYGYNVYEILILLCYVMGVSMLIFGIFGMVDSFIKHPIADKGYFLGVLYIFWSISDFFDRKKIINYIKAILSYFLGMLTFILIIFIIGYLFQQIQSSF